MAYADADDLDEAEATALADLDVHVKHWKGWRVSYRLREPEKEPAEKCAKRIQRKMKSSIDRPFSTVGPRTKSAEDRKVASDKIAARQKARSAAVKAAGILPG